MGENVGRERFDAVVVGAGFAGMYMLHRLRELGRSAVVLEAGTDVGGTWYWNRYPGARCDVPSMEYSYSFDDELQQEWEWTEIMAAQPEILRYARHVADRFDLRRDIRFETTVVSARFDEADALWTVTTDDGGEIAARFCVMATGCLSVPNTPDLPGLDRFGGTTLHTGFWPKDPPSRAGQRVGVIGTGSSGVQAIPVIAAEAGHTHVFQRTPVYTFPANNKPLRADVQQSYKEHYAEVRELQRSSPAGFSGFDPLRPDRAARTVSVADDGKASSTRTSFGELSRDEQRELFDTVGFNVFRRHSDIYRDPEVNEQACDLYRDVVREMVDDPDVAEGLLPTDYPLGCKRQVIDTDYYATFNRPDVTLVDLRRDPLVGITEAGVEVTSGEVPLDVLVLATGFDAMTGALQRIDIRGRGDVALRDAWADGPRTYLGWQVAGFPNLFTITGPGSPSVLSNMIVSIEHHVDLVADCLRHLDAVGGTTIEPDAEAQDRWVDHVNEVAEGTMYTAPNCSSWYLGSNIPGKPRMIFPYVGGVGRYRRRCDEIVAEGWAGFVID